MHTHFADDISLLRNVLAARSRRIGKALGKSIRLSIVALHSVDGVHQQFKELVKLAEELGSPRDMETPRRVTESYGD